MTKSNAKSKPAPAPSINERLMIVRLSVSQWYPRRFDRKATNIVEEAVRAEIGDVPESKRENVGRFNKILIELASLKPLQRACAEIKIANYSMTAPWTDDGARVLTTDLYFDYVEKMREHTTTIRQLASEFASGTYAEQIARARARLGKLFNAEDYPDASEIADRFAVRSRFEPLPNPEDVRVWGISSTAAREIEQQVRADVEGAINAAQRHVVEQVTERAREFIEKVGRFHNGDTSMLYETAVTNLRDVVEMVLRGLNVTGDAELSRSASDLKTALEGLTIQQFRTGADLRVEKMREVEKIASRFAGIYGSKR